MDSRAALPDSLPDYYIRALAVWPRLGHPRPASLRHDPRRMARLISRRTTLPVEVILALLGAPADDAGSPRAGQ
jgi:hypothetical protein